MSSANVHLIMNAQCILTSARLYFWMAELLTGVHIVGMVSRFPHPVAAVNALPDIIAPVWFAVCGIARDTIPYQEHWLQVMVCYGGLMSTWLILPAVICLSQRLSHACLSISSNMAKLRMAH